MAAIDEMNWAAAWPARVSFEASVRKANSLTEFLVFTSTL